MKIVTIGAGSVVWGPTINTDFLLNPELDGAELMLMDIDADSLGRVHRLLERYVRERGFQKSISATTDLREALANADYVITAISVGGDHMWRYDAMFPHIYSIYQPVGDTVGPGGLMRALRHAGPLLQVARQMREVSRPDATLIQLTNPMNPLCTALEQIEGIKVYGICHGIDGTRRIVADRFGVKADDVRIDAAGNNHFIFCDSIEICGKKYAQDEFAELTPTIFDTPFRQAVWEQYGGLVGNDSRHPIEFLPDFLTPEYGFGKDWGVPPIAVQIDPIHGDRHDNAVERLEYALDQTETIRWRSEHQQGGLKITDDGHVETGHSREGLDEFIAALELGTELDIHVNVRNEDSIDGVDPSYNVELPVRFEGGKMHRKSIRFNDRITSEINRVGKEQDLIGRACLAYDKDMLVEALTLDALVPSRDVAGRLIDEMTAYQHDYLEPYYPDV